MTLQDVVDKLYWEGGFDYFIGGSEFAEVKDAHFHFLRKAFVRAHSELDEYLSDNTSSDNDNDNEEDDDGA